MNQGTPAKGVVAGAAPRASRAPRRKVAESRRERLDPLSVLVGVFGISVCLGLIYASVSPQQHRYIKHAFYIGLALLLLRDSAAATQVARRDPWVWALVALMGFSALWSDSPVWAFKRSVVTFQTTTLGLFIAMRFRLEDQVRLVAWMLLFTLVANVGYLFAFPAKSYMVYEGERAFMGFMGHKNAIGLITAVALPVFLLQAGRRGRDRWVMFGGMALGVGVLTIARSLTGATVGATLCMIVLLLPLSMRLRRPAILLLPPLAVLTGTLAAMAGLADQVLILLGRDPTFTGRTDIWSSVLPVIAERPLLGHSIVSFWQRSIVSTSHVWFSNAHNGFLQVTIELGLVGLFFLVSQISTTYFHALRWHGRQVGRGAVWPLCMTSLFLLFNLSEVVLMSENSIIWVLVVATSLGVRRAGAERRRGPW